MQSQGITLKSNPTSFATTMVAIAGITKLPLPKVTHGTIDMSALDSPNNWEEIEISLLKRTGELEFEYNTKEARIEAIETINATEAVNYYQVVFPGFTKSWWFAGLMLEHDSGEASVDAKVTGKFKIKITGKPYFQATAPS
jgi:hypothetical protein